MNQCRFNDCHNQAKKGHEYCKAHGSSSKAQSSTTTITSTKPPIAMQHGKSVLVMPVLVDVELRHLREENKALKSQLERLNQIEADRLRFEQASRDAWNKMADLEKTNQEMLAEVKKLEKDNHELSKDNHELRSEVEKLKEDVKRLDQVVKEQQGDSALLEVAQLLRNFEWKVVKDIDISGYASYLSQIHIFPGSKEVEQWKKRFKLDVTDLFALSTILTAIRTPRNEVAHPNKLDINNIELWKKTLHDYCLHRVTDYSIKNLVDVAVRECSDCF